MPPPRRSACINLSHGSRSIASAIRNVVASSLTGSLAHAASGSPPNSRQRRVRSCRVRPIPSQSRFMGVCCQFSLISAIHPVWYLASRVMNAGGSTEMATARRPGTGRRVGHAGARLRAAGRTTKPSPPATSGRSRSRSGTLERWPGPLVPSSQPWPALGRLPARMGITRRKLERGERRLPGQSGPDSRFRESPTSVCIALRLEAPARIQIKLKAIVAHTFFRPAQTRNTNPVAPTAIIFSAQDDD